MEELKICRIYIIYYNRHIKRIMKKTEKNVLIGYYVSQLEYWRKVQKQKRKELKNAI